MFGKLLKHEFRAAGRLMLPIWIALPVLGLFTLLSIWLLERTDMVLTNILGTLVIGLFVLGCFAAGVMILVTVVLRFQKSMFSREGYLTHTLPVTVHGLVWSRLVVALVYLLVTILVIIASLLIATAGSGLVAELREVLPIVFREVFVATGIHGTVYLLEFLGLMLVAVAGTWLAFYAAMAIGHSFSNYKVLLSVVFYFVIYTCQQVVGVIFLAILGSGTLRALETMTQEAQLLSQVHGLLLLLIGFYVFLAAVYYLLTTGLLKRRLNLQ